MKISNLEKKPMNLEKILFIQFVKKGEAHLGGSFSMIEILLAIYEVILKKKR